jgi:hypothetical protein
VEQIRKRLTYANVMSTIAVFLLLGGGAAFAAGQLGKNTVGSKQLKSNAVTTGKIKKEAVAEGKIKNGSVTGAKIANGAVGTAQLAEKAVTSAKLGETSVSTGKLANNAVTAAKLGADAVTTEKLANNAVNTEKLANGAVTTAKLAGKAVGFGQLDLTFVSGQVNVSAGENKSVTAVCPAGTTVISGGGGFPGVPGNEVSFVSSEIAGGGWSTEGRSLAGVHTLVVQAYCIRNP